MKLIGQTQCLLEQLKQDLLDCGSQDLSDTTVVLPTQRLGTYLVAWLTKEIGALFPPRILTLEQFIEEFAPGTELAIVPDTALDLWLERRLERQDLRHLYPRHSRELRLIDNEMVENRVSLDCLSQFSESLRQDCFRSDNHQQFLLQRIESIFLVLEELQAFLQEHQLTTRARQLAAKACLLAERWGKTDRCPAAEKVMIAGFTSLANSWQPLLTKLYQMENVTFYFMVPPVLHSKHHPLTKLMLEVTGKDIEPVHSTKAFPPHHAHLIEYDSIMDECLGAMKCAQKYIDGGLPPSQVAILVTNETLYAPFIHNLISLFPGDVNIPIGLPFAGCSAGNWLQLWWRCLEEPVNANAFFDWLSHPATITKVNEYLEEKEEKSNFVEVVSWAAELINHREFRGWGQTLPTLGGDVSLTVACEKMIILALRNPKKIVSATHESLSLIDLVQSLLVAFDPFSHEPKAGGLESASKEVFNSFFLQKSLV